MAGDGHPRQMTISLTTGSSRRREKQNSAYGSTSIGPPDAKARGAESCAPCRKRGRRFTFFQRVGLANSREVAMSTHLGGLGAMAAVTLALPALRISTQLSYKLVRLRPA